MTKLQAGTAKIDITPPVGTPLIGYIEKERQEEGAIAIHDPLYAKCLVVDDGATKIAMVTTDLIGVDKDFTAAIRDQVEYITDLKGSNILISSTHTHCGPAGTTWSPGLSPGLLDKQSETVMNFLDNLRKVYIWKIAGIIIEANKKLQPVEIGVGAGILESGVICTNRNAPKDGPFDPELLVLRVDNEKNEAAAIFSNYSCHPTVVPYDVVEVTADFPGYGMALVEQTFPNCIGLHSTGAEGDISTRWPRWEQTHREAKRIGEILGAEVIKTTHQIKTTANLRIKSAFRKITLPLKDFPSLEEARATYLKNKEKLAALDAKKGSPKYRTVYNTMLGSKFEYYHIKHQEFEGNSIETVLQTLAIGDLGIVAIPGEMFTALQLEIKEKSPFKKTMVIALANDNIDYILDPVAYDNKAIYESGSTFLGKEAGKILVAASVEMLESLRN